MYAHTYAKDMYHHSIASNRNSQERNLNDNQ